MADVCLTDRDAVLSGHRVTCIAQDLVLEGGSDRRVVEGGDRRALVHDFEDGLTLNWEEDYPGGVTIRGAVQIPGQASIASLRLRVQRGRRKPRYVDAATELIELQAKVGELENRIAALEAGSA